MDWNLFLARVTHASVAALSCVLRGFLLLEKLRAVDAAYRHHAWANENTVSVFALEVAAALHAAVVFADSLSKFDSEKSSFVILHRSCKSASGPSVRRDNR